MAVLINRFFLQNYLVKRPNLYFDPSPRYASRVQSARQVYNQI